MSIGRGDFAAEILGSEPLLEKRAENDLSVVHYIALRSLLKLGLRIREKDTFDQSKTQKLTDADPSVLLNNNGSLWSPNEMVQATKANKLLQERKQSAR